ncbi:MAG: helix-turn-helix transcriptional regulator [Clostridia bacterium]|nr:helix-turn-helix transcriptional regulator [Clostridia bacterium]
MTIGERIKMLRRRNDLTQEKLAEFLSVSPQAVSKWECGLACPDLALIMPLTKLLHVTADELLGGDDAENDVRRAELDTLCSNYWKYGREEMYQAAQQAVSEYPGDYKYLQWLANMEIVMDLHECAIQHNNMIIEQCGDSHLRNRAIWDTMFSHKKLGQYEEALKYAEMLPDENYITRSKAMLECLQGEELERHKQLMVLKNLQALCRTLTQFYQYETEKKPQVTAALDLKEAVLETIFPDGNYMGFCLELCYVYEKRAELELNAGEYDKAVEYLHRVVGFVRKYVELCDEPRMYTCDIFNKICMKLDINSSHRPFIFVGDARNTRPIMEQLRIALTTEEQFAPLWEREDFRRLLEEV